MYMIIWSTLLACVLCLILGPLVIPILIKLKFGQNVRDDGPKSHLKKAGTPAMGGLFMLGAVLLACLVLLRGNVEYTLVPLLFTLLFGLMGFLDDWIKVVRRRSLGLRARQKIAFQILLSAIIAVYAYFEIGPVVLVPFASGVEWNMGWVFIPFTMLVVIAVVNSVNLTDGLDGLASSVTAAVMLAFAVSAGLLAADVLALGNPMGADRIEGAITFGGAVAGACMGFLAFNANPAKVFMGDTGSLALGGAVVMIAIVLRMQLFLPIMGLMYVLSSGSCILQVASVKLRKRRMFKMAPLHHHFELKGASETRIMAMYTAVTVLCCLLGMGALM